MKSKYWPAALVLCACAGALNAQTGGNPLPDATVGVPYSFDIGQGLFQLDQLLAGLNEDGVTVSFGFSGGAGLPPGLAVNASGLLSGTPTAPGNYPFTLTFIFHIASTDFNFDFSQPVPLAMTVVGSGIGVAIEPSGLSFSFTQGSSTVKSQSITISNRGSQPQAYSVKTASGGQWLSASGGGTAAPFGTGSVSVSIDPSGLPAGTYVGTVSISLAPSGQTFNVMVVATVSSGQQQLQLSQTGLRFQTVSGGGTPPPQSILVLSSGSGTVNFSVSQTTLSGGPGWLSVSPGSGSAGPSSSTPVAVSINPAGLAPGDYYGTLQFSASNVVNSPQTASVVLNIAPAGTDLGAFVQPTGMIFVGAVGGANPAPKTVTITNPSNSPLSFSSTAFFQNGNGWFAVQPIGGTVTAQSPVQLTVKPNTSGLAAGVYVGELALRFPTDNTSRRVAVLLIVLPAGAIPAVQSLVEPSAISLRPLVAGCTPTKLLPVFTLLGDGFTTVAAWPTSIEATVVDDCGTPLVAGSVVASFSSGDPPLSLTSLRDGRWSATWQSHTASQQVTVTVRAKQLSPALEGTAMIGGALQANPTAPVIYSGGVVSAASLAGNQPLAPGSYIAIFGDHMSTGQNQSSTVPLSTQLGSTIVALGGRVLPLNYASPGFISAIIPFDVPTNTTQQMLISNGPTVSVPEPIVIAPAQPAMFSRDQSGRGAGIVIGFKANTPPFLVDTSHPVSADDVLQIYCAGLGAVDPPVPAGTAASLTQVSNTTNPVTVSIGGKPARVVFSGLAPGYTGIYQVNVVVPGGVAPGDDVPVVISAAGLDSTPVTIVIR